MNVSALLISQCLQNDFVQPIGRYDPLPNRLHVGHEEARRLMGERPAEGPLARMMDWAASQPLNQLKMIHIRDWHSADDPDQREHLKLFGAHCIQGTPGAEFVFSLSETPEDQTTIINSPGLNDFHDTELQSTIQNCCDQDTRVGILGVWTEAKITFLAYELRTRFPDLPIAVCSALCASSSTAQHFVALDQLEKILSVRVIPSPGAFIEFLGGESVSLGSTINSSYPEIQSLDNSSLSEDDTYLLRYLHRDCRKVSARTLDGGFSGNVVLGVSSTDIHGHEQVAHVVKIGPRDLIGKERASFERIEAVLGNSAPRIADFADFKERGAIKYRYASMGGGFSTTFQKQYMTGIGLSKVESILHTVFVKQLGRFYVAKKRESCDLLEYYCFDKKFAPGVRRRVEALLPSPADQDDIPFFAARTIPNICRFYEEGLDTLPRQPADSHYFSYIHGDLNGANIIIDAQENVWLIDFFHTHFGHILKDLIKLENDLLYIFTPISNEEELAQALSLTDLLLEVSDLGKPLPPLAESSVRSPQLLRAYETLSVLRSFYPELVESDRNPLQLQIAQLRYAVHTIGFDESNEWQKRWALYTAAHCSAKISRALRSSGPLRIDYLDQDLTAPGRLGLSLLPGRRDLHRSIAADLTTLSAEGITHIVCLVPLDELNRYGVGDLLLNYREAGFEFYHLPIVDQAVCSHDEAQEVSAWIEQALSANGNVFVHCVGGLGRSGTIAAYYLRQQGQSAEAAIRSVRSARSSRALENPRQETFVAEAV